MEINQKQGNINAHIWGSSFHGQVELYGDKLRLEITQFKKGDIYISEITNLDLEKQHKRFLVFKKIEDIFEELRTNKKLQVSDTHTLIIPVEVVYKNKLIDLNIEIILSQMKFNNETDKMQTLLENMSKIGENLKKKNAEPIFFIGDESNQNYKYFKQSNHGKSVEIVQQMQEVIYNHSKPLDKVGISYFKIKITRTNKKIITVGICGDNIKSFTGSKALNSPFFMGISFLDNKLKPLNQQVSGLSIYSGSVVKVEVNMSLGIVSWFHNDEFIHSAHIAQQLKAVNIHPMITMQAQGDTVEFLRK